MSLSVAEHLPRPPRATTAATAAPPMTLPVLVLVGTVLSILLCWSTVMVIWRTGTFFDTDDAMRMVQVRAWMAGQGWFDLAAHRLDPPGGVVMHWSRVVDVPLAMLDRVFSIFVAAPQAERLTRIVFPIGLQAALIAATIFTARVLVGPAAGLPAMLLAVTSAIQFGQFVPGRVDHHAPQITLLMLMTGLAADAMLHGRRASAVLAACAIALSLAISLENVPFIAVLVGAVAMSWILGGYDRGPMLRAFGLALAAAAAAMFAATVAPWRYTLVVADAFSLPHLLGAILGGAALSMLAALPLFTTTVARRALATAGAGLAVGIAVVTICPGVLASPYAQLDPVVRLVWLARVTEALPLFTAVRLHPQAGTLIVAPLLAGIVAMLCATFRERGALRGAWLFVAAMTLAGLAGAMWEVRVISSATPLGLLGGAWAFVCFTRRTAATLSSASRAAGAALILLPFCPLAWAVVPVAEESAMTMRATKGAELCREADHVAPLATLGPGTIFAPIDSGSHLLAHTDLSVIGAPYHRNNHGNRLVIDGFSAEGTEAERIVKATGARYVALCPGQVQAEALTARNPNGLAAQLLASRPPAWLEQIDVPGTPYLVFAVK